MGKIITFPTAAVFTPLLGKARYKGAHGGRGSGKSQFFAELLIDRCLSNKGTRAICVREIQKSLRFSVKQLIEDVIRNRGLESRFNIQNEVIITPGNGIIIFQGMQNHTTDSVKSLAGFDIVWVEEAQTLSNDSLTALRPTMRKDGSELWFSWNPRNATDPVDKFLRSDTSANDPDIICVEANWRDNPWFPKELEDERLRDSKGNKAEYDWIWEGAYRQSAGAYFNEELFLEDGEPIKFPAPIDYIFATMDTSLKGGRGNDGTAICYFGVNKLTGHLAGRTPLTILDWDIVEMEASSLPGWIPSIRSKMEELAKITKARSNVLTLLIEDKAAGCVLLQECEKRRISDKAINGKVLVTKAIDSKITSIGKDNRAFNFARYVNTGQVRISDWAWNKKSVYADENTNHLRKQLFSFRMGDPEARTRQDDLLDCVCYGGALSLGNSKGF